MTSWYELLKKAFEANGEVFEDMICTLSDEELHKKFNAYAYGKEEGAPFTAWGREFVYFPLTYDGQEEVGSAPRDPCDIALPHQGGS